MRPDPWLKSKRVWAAVLMCIVSVATLLGYDIPDETQSLLLEVLTTFGGVVAALIAIWSKIKEGKNAN